jgi:hypothetical protein
VKPGGILRRAVGSSDPFREHAELPTNLSKVEIERKPRSNAKKRCAGTTDGKTTREAALAFEKAERRA